MRRLAWAVVAALLLGEPRSAPAIIGTIDQVPATTLLLPYFEVDPAGNAATGTNTTLSVTDVSAFAVLTNVTIWTDASVPVTSFNVYFTGYDTIVLDLRAILGGTLPVTATAGQDPMDTFSPKGPDSQDINYASCSGGGPGGLPPETPEASAVAKWRAALSGKPDPETGQCAGFDHGDGILRGYVTVDAVVSCGTITPAEPGYFGGPAGYPQNHLIGEWTLVNGGRRFHASPLVALEASLTSSQTITLQEYTFYGRYVLSTAMDHTESLATNFATRFAVGGGTGTPNSTTLVVWRDPRVNQKPFACGTPPAWFPLGQESIVFFDEQEDNETPGDVKPFPLATQRVDVDSGALPTTFASGWLYLNLNTTVPLAPGDGPKDPAAAQAWVEVLHHDDDPAAYGAHGHVGFTLPATQLDNADTAVHTAKPK